jgi:hypothetical protein
MISVPAKISIEKLIIRPRTIERARRQDDGDFAVAPAKKTTGSTGKTHGEIPAMRPATKPMRTKNTSRLSPKRSKRRLS